MLPIRELYPRDGIRSRIDGYEFDDDVTRRIRYDISWMPSVWKHLEDILRLIWIFLFCISFVKLLKSNLDSVIRVWAHNPVNYISRMHYESIVRRTINVLRVVRNSIRWIWHCQSGQFRVQITVCILLKS